MKPVSKEKTKKVMDEIVGEEKMTALARNPDAMLRSYRVVRRMCRSCQRRAMGAVMSGKSWDNSMLCPKCIKWYKVEESKWK